MRNYPVFDTDVCPTCGESLVPWLVSSASSPSPSPSPLGDPSGALEPPLALPSIPPPLPPPPLPLPPLPLSVAPSCLPPTASPAHDTVLAYLAVVDHHRAVHLDSGRVHLDSGHVPAASLEYHSGPNPYVLGLVRAFRYDGDGEFAIDARDYVCDGATSAPLHDAGATARAPKNPVRFRRGRWTKSEKAAFESGIKALGKGSWSRIACSFVKTRSAEQVRSHAQKFFAKARQVDRETA